MERKGQAQIIVTVLIILLVLVIIGIVSTLVVRTVRQGAEEAGSSVECLKLQMEVAFAAENNSIVVTRNPGGGDISGYKVIVDGNTVVANGTSNDGSALAPLTSETFVNDSISSTSKVEIAPILADGAQCGVLASTG